MRRGLAIVVGLALTATSVLGVPDVRAETQWPGGRWEPGKPRYGSELVLNVPVDMDDGVTLEANLAYPTDLATRTRASGAFPVILRLTPYEQEGLPETFFAEHGYIVANVRARGTGRSGGKNGFWDDRDARDGAAVIAWASRLPGSDGRVGMYGCSWPGALALRAASFSGPKSPLRALVAACISSANLAEEAAISGGIPTEGMRAIPPIIGVAGTSTSPASHEWFLTKFYPSVLQGGPPAYRDFWETRLTVRDAIRIADSRIPTLLWTGWDDIFVRGALETFGAFQNHVADRPAQEPMPPGSRTTGRYQIVVGPWAHGEGLDLSLILLWFDTFVKNEATGLQKIGTPVHLYERGTARWVNTSTYPTVARVTSFYLDRNELSSRRPRRTGVFSLSWTPASLPAGSASFMSEPFPKGATLSGPVALTISGSSSNTNLQLNATLYDVAPDGASQQVTTGTVLGSQRATIPSRNWFDRAGKLTRPVWSQNRDDYLTPGLTERFDIALSPRQWGFAPGHRLELRLTTQHGERCGDLIGSDPCFYTAPQMRTLPGGEYVFHSGPRAVLNVPLLPFKHFKTARSATTATSEGEEEPLDWG